jgi:hypothetical protein
LQAHRIGGAFNDDATWVPRKKNMSNRSWFIGVLVLSSASGAAIAQQQAGSPPKPAAQMLRVAAAQKPPAPKANGPSLEFTMEYIQDKLISRGVLNYDVYLHEGVTGKDWSYQFVDKLSGTYANPDTCQIGFHWKQTRSGQVVTDREIYVDLSTGAKLSILTMDQYLTESAAKSGHPSWTTRVSPSLFVLRINKPDNQESNFVFPEEDTANHLAKALGHAVELCGSAQAAAAPSGNKEPF